MEIKVDKEKAKKVAEAIAGIKKTQGVDAADFYSNVGSDIKIERVSTGLISLDLAIGGGLPKGDYIELMGKPSMGKTTLCLGIMSRIMRNGGIVAFIDVENDFDPTWAAVHGIKDELMDQFIISQPSTLEIALDVVDGLIKSGGVDLIVIDSMASLTPETVLKNSMSQETIGLKPRKLAQFFDKTKYFVRKSGTIVMFTNQHRENPAPFSVSDSPGGWSAKHHFGIRMEISRRSTDILKIGEEAWGVRSHIITKKNKVYRPFLSAEFVIDFEHGLSYEHDLLTAALDTEVITKKGSWYYLDDLQLAQGERNVTLLLREDRELFDEVNKLTRDKLGLSVV